MSHLFRSGLPSAILILAFAGVLSGSGSAAAPSTKKQPAKTTLPSSAVPMETALAPAATVHVAVDVLSNRHPISPYVYGGAYPKDAATITDSGITVVRWGGNATSRYNWKAGTYNAANDWYYADFGYTEIGDADSAKFIQDVKAAGSNPLMTMVMLDWVANGLKPDCSTPITGNDPNDANFPLRDSPQNGDPPSTLYRNQWTAALATAFGSAPHFYDMDNEIDIWHSSGCPSTAGLIQRNARQVHSRSARPEDVGSGGHPSRSGELLLVVLLERR
jgi:hypothetical protein